MGTSLLRMTGTRGIRITSHNVTYSLISPFSGQSYKLIIRRVVLRPQDEVLVNG